MKRGVRQFKGLLVLLLAVLLTTVFAHGIISSNLILISAPSNNTWTNGSNNTITFEYNQTLNGSVVPSAVNCTLVINEVDYGTNHSTDANSTNSVKANRTLSEGRKLWGIRCINTTVALGNILSLNFTLTIDRTVPNITSNLPASSLNTSSQTVNFNWTIVDNLATQVTCNLTINSSVNATVVSNNGSTDNFSVTFGLDTNYTWNVTCQDNATNTNTSVTRVVTIDTVKPNVSSITPTTANEDTATRWNATVTDATTGIHSCTLYLSNISNGIMLANGTMSNITQELVNLTLTLAAPGVYNMTANCSDTAGNYNDSMITEITINDTTAPVWDETPPNKTHEIGAAYSVEINATDNYVIGVYGIEGDTTNFTINQSGILRNNTLLKMGYYYVNVTVNDTQGNLRSERINISVNDSTAPTWVEIPKNKTLEWRKDLYYDINATDKNETNQYGIEGDQTNFTINSTTGLLRNNTDLQPGNDIWLNLTINDSSGNLRYVRINVTILNTTPYVESTSVLSIGTSSATINVTANEQVNITINYGTTVSLGTNSTNTSYIPAHSIALTGLAVYAVHYYNITISDLSGLTNTSGPYSFKTAALPASSTGGSGGSSSGDTGLTSIPYKTVDSAVVEASLTKVWAALEANEIGIFNIAVETIPVTAVTVSVNKNVASPTLRVGVLSGKPSVITEPQAKIYKYLELTKTVMTSTDINSASVTFKVPKSWLNTNNVAADTVALYRYADNTWTKLTTTVSKEDTENVYYSASTPGFSYFAIGGKAAVSAVKEAPAPAAAEPVTSAEVVEKAAGSTALLIIIAVLIVAIVLYFVLGKKKTKQI